MRADSAVEPTKSENITVTWRRSAVPLGAWLAARLSGDRCVRGSDKLRNRPQHLPPMPERDTKLFKVLIGQVAKNGDIDVALGKALRVLGHAERFEPVHNLLHRGPRGGCIVACRSFWIGSTRSLSYPLRY